MDRGHVIMPDDPRKAPLDDRRVHNLKAELRYIIARIISGSGDADYIRRVLEAIRGTDPAENNEEV